MIKRPQSSLSLFLILILATLSASKYIEVPAIREKMDQEIKMGTTVELTEPNFDFSKVYRKEVSKLEDKKMGVFPPCFENHPEVEFNVRDQLIFEGLPKKPEIIFNFEDIIYSQFLLDVFYDAGHVYMIFQNGRVAVTQINKKSHTIEGSVVFSVEGLEKDQKLKIGYFLKLQDQIVFINNDRAVAVHDKSASVITGMVPNPEYQTAITFEEKYICTGDRKQGITFYSLSEDKKSMTKVGKIEPSSIHQNGNIELSDLAYFKQNSVLLVLDENQGVFSLKLEITNDSVTVKQKSEIINRKLCELMYLYGHTLYVLCDEVYSYYLGEWPKIEESIIGHPNIKVREIFQNEDVLAFAGRNTFKVMYLDRFVNYFMDTNLDKLLFLDDLFISANENGIILGEFKIIKPYITCRTRNSKYSGEHSLVFKTYAECNSTYFLNYKIDPASLGEITDDDICVYTVYKDVYFWEKGEIKTFPIILVFLILVFVTIGVFLVWFFKNKKLKFAQLKLSEYSSIKNSGESGKYQKFSEEMIDEPGKSQTTDQLKNEEPKPVNKAESEMKEDQVEVNSDKFDIQ